MAGGGTNVLFVPYRPRSKSKGPPPEHEPAISQQKHAAREYHRKAKLGRLTKLRASHSQDARSTSVPAANVQFDSSSRQLLPRIKSFPGGEDHDGSFAVFDAGTGQFDPFNACVPSGVPAYALDILDYATSKQWQIFSSSKTVVGEETIKNAVFACAMQSPAAFWSIVFAGATHNAYLQKGTDTPSRNRALRLSYKSQAIIELNHEIQALQGVAPDELLLAIITLAAHGTGEQLDPPLQGEDVSVLEAVQNFQYYGRMRWEVAHFKAVACLVYQKGGLHNVKMPGLANAISLADIFFAFLDLQTPAFPLLAPTSLIMSTWPRPPSLLASTLQNLTSSFEEFRELQGFATLWQIIANARSITIGLVMHLSQHPEAPTLTRIVWARNFMVHDLLSLYQTVDDPCNESFPEQQSPERSGSSRNVLSFPHSLYSLIRLSTLAYTLLVLFPVPRVAGLHGRLSRQLMLALDDCVVLELCTTHPNLLLWATILGGTISEEGGLKPWFAEMTRQARMRSSNLALVDSLAQSRSGGRQRSRSHSRGHSTSDGASKREADATWTIVRDICFRFLWFDGPECDGAARAFWNKACESILSRR